MSSVPRRFSSTRFYLIRMAWSQRAKNGKVGRTKIGFAGVQGWPRNVLAPRRSPADGRTTITSNHGRKWPHLYRRGAGARSGSRLRRLGQLGRLLRTRGHTVAGVELIPNQAELSRGAILITSSRPTSKPTIFLSPPARSTRSFSPMCWNISSTLGECCVNRPICYRPAVV